LPSKESEHVCTAWSFFSSKLLHNFLRFILA
jgi:hypothetical protein